MIAACSIAPSVLFSVLILRGPHGPGAQSLAPCGLCAEGRTMSYTDAIIRREIESDDERIRRALERGGLPTEAEAEKLHRDLMGLLEELEAITWRVEGIALSDGGGDIPEVTLEQIGVVAMLISDLKGEIGTLASLHERIGSRVSSLFGIRAQQQFDQQRPSDA
jgi:hypothetical protein